MDNFADLRPDLGEEALQRSKAANGRNITQNVGTKSSEFGAIGINQDVSLSTVSPRAEHLLTQLGSKPDVEDF
jgi:hypothetical protein